MSYIEEINEIISHIDSSFVNFNEDRKRTSAPTQVSSEFLTNKEQGDWAERTLLTVINKNSQKYVAVKYGKNDNIIAGEEKFKEFYESYQNELSDIGKRPDILIFEKKDYPYDNIDNISNFSRNDLDALVPKAKCGIEVRSSAFLIDKYEIAMKEEHSKLLQEAFEIQSKILEPKREMILKEKNEELYKIIKGLTHANIDVQSYRVPSWKTTKELQELSADLKTLRAIMKNYPIGLS